MRKFIYFAAAVSCVPAFAQNQVQTQPPATERTVPATPSTAPDSTAERISQGLSNIIADYRLEDLPPAVQKTVREQSAGQEIDDIDRETRTGRVVWEIEFEKDGLDREIHIAQDGSIITDPGLLGQIGEPESGVGAAAGTQSGRSDRASMNLKWEEIPHVIREKAAQFGGKDKVDDIDREIENGQVKYEIEFKREGRNLEIEFGNDGSILASSDPSVAPVGASSATESTGNATRQPAQSTQPDQPRTGTQPR